jgi:hypothetical protein
VESRVGGFVSSAGASVPAGSGWRSAVFPLAAVGVDVEPVLGEVTRLRIVHAPTSDGAVPILGALGVDNVTALSGELCVDAGLAGGDLAICRAYCDELQCPNDGRGEACLRLADRLALRSGRPPPCDLDDDGDGVEDTVDNCPDVSNADQADADADGFGDACDNCPRDPNPGQEDGFGDPRLGDVCECPCFSPLEVASLVGTLSDSSTYGELTCVDTRVPAKPLSYVRAVRLDGGPCAVETHDCSALAVEFTEDDVCQFHPAAPDPGRVVQGISGRQRELCREGIVAAAQQGGLSCD